MAVWKSQVGPHQSFFADYARYIDAMRAIEVKYAYNPDQAKTVIDAEMKAMGATLGSDGKWQFNGAPVTVIAIIRTEDKRKQIGDYVCNQLETIGFTCDRQYKTRSEASPLWNASDPAEGLCHFTPVAGSARRSAAMTAPTLAAFYTPLYGATPLAAYAKRPRQNFGNLLPKTVE